MEDSRILDEYKAKIETEKNNLAQLRAEKKIVVKNLKEEFQVDNIEEAEKRLVRIKRQIESLQKEFTQKIDEIKGEFPL